MDEQRQLIVRVHMDCSIDHLSSHLAPAAALPLPDDTSHAPIARCGLPIAETEAGESVCRIERLHRCAAATTVLRLAICGSQRSGVCTAEHLR